MRLAFFVEGRTGWIAGHTYLYNLLRALRLCNRQIEICLLRKSGDDLSSSTVGLTELADQVLDCPTLQRWSLPWVQGHVYQKALRRVYPDKTLNDFLEAKRIDVVFGSWWQYPGWWERPGSSVFPSVGMCAWIHDFQFLHFPGFYDRITLQGTRRGISVMADIADRLVVSSQDALKDLLSFTPGAAAKARVLPFVASIADDIYARDPELVVRQYHLPQKFVYLPNQFWQHKNHELVLEALSILVERGVHPQIVCTGLPHDSRKEAHFAGLLRQVSEKGLHGQLVFLGLVPFDHVKALMRQAICVLNPSLFEGWSSTVEEAKSLGKLLLLSDLSVHREQNPPAAMFFDRHDAGDLATKLRTVWEDRDPGPDPQLETVARQSLPGRMRAFGEAFLTVASEVSRTPR